MVVLQVATTKATKEDQSMVLALTHKAPDPGCTPSCNQGTSFNSSNYVWSILFEYHLNPLNFRLKTSVSVITCNGEKKNAGVISTTGRTKTIQKMSFFLGDCYWNYAVLHFSWSTNHILRPSLRHFIRMEVTCEPWRLFQSAWLSGLMAKKNCTKYMNHSCLWPF